MMQHLWVDLFNRYLREWTETYTDWLTNYHNPIHVVLYENLVNDTRKELKNVLHFLNINVSEVYSNYLFICDSQCVLVKLEAYGTLCPRVTLCDFKALYGTITVMDMVWVSTPSDKPTYNSCSAT